MQTQLRSTQPFVYPFVPKRPRIDIASSLPISKQRFRPNLTPIPLQPSEYYFTSTALRRVINRLQACQPQPRDVVIQLGHVDTMRSVDALRYAAAKQSRPELYLHTLPLVAILTATAFFATLIFIRWLNF